MASFDDSERQVAGKVRRRRRRVVKSSVVRLLFRARAARPLNDVPFSPSLLPACVRQEVHAIQTNAVDDQAHLIELNLHDTTRPRMCFVTM